MKEDEMLMCLIAFVLGYLVARMMRGNGLMVGGSVLDTPACPGNSTKKKGSNYCTDMNGYCRGIDLNGDLDFINGKYNRSRYVYPVETRKKCKSFCDEEPTCVGYEFEASKKACSVYGPGIDGRGDSNWSSQRSDLTTIDTIKYVDDGNDAICVAVAGKN